MTGISTPAPVVCAAIAGAVRVGLTVPCRADQVRVVREFVRAMAPLQRSGTPEDVAHVILGLVGARYVTGEIVMVDGGLRLR